MKLKASLAAVAVFAGVANADVIITGIMDGDLSGGTPKAIELWVGGTEDLGAYSVERSANGGAWGSSFNLSGTYTDEFVYLVGTQFSGVTNFQSVFGTAGDFANIISSGNVSGNGNDGFRLVIGSTVIDQVWTTDDSNVYMDSFMYRLDETGPDGGWNASDWTMAGNGALDGMSAAEQGSAVPFGTYAPVPEPASIALMAAGALALVRRRR